MTGVGVDADHHRQRLLQDVLVEATSAYWRARAETFESARPGSGDYTGQATPIELAALDARCAAAALACHHRADLVIPVVETTTVDDVLAEVA